MRLRFFVVAALLSVGAAPAFAQSLTTAHCLGGCPTGDGTAANQVIVRPAYTLSNNPVTKFADWIAYRVDATGFGPSRDRVWAADPDLPATATLEPDDYRGANAALKTDRGHQAPLASFAGLESWATTNYLSNITPQASALNQGPWKNLESAVRALAKTSGAPVYVITGPLYERPMAPLPQADEAHVVPSGYFKIVALSEGRAVAAFIMDQSLARGAAFCATTVGLDQVERRAGLHVMPRREAVGPPDAVMTGLGCPS